MQITVSDFTYSIFIEDLEPYLKSSVDSDILNAFLNSPVISSYDFYHSYAPDIASKNSCSIRSVYNHLKGIKIIRRYGRIDNSYYIILPEELHNLFKKYSVSPVRFFKVYSRLLLHVQNIDSFYRYNLIKYIQFYFSHCRDNISAFDEATGHALTKYVLCCRELVRRIII